MEMETRASALHPLYRSCCYTPTSSKFAPEPAALASPGNLLEMKTFWPHPRPKRWEDCQVSPGKVEPWVDFAGQRAHLQAPCFMCRQLQRDSRVAEVLQVRDMERKG